MDESTSNVENSRPTDDKDTNVTSKELTNTPYIDPPAADTAAAAVQRYEAQQTRLKEQSHKRQQLLQEYRERYQAHVEIMQTTKTTIRSEKMA